MQVVHLDGNEARLISWNSPPHWGPSSCSGGLTRKGAASVSAGLRFPLSLLYCFPPQVPKKSETAALTRSKLQRADRSYFFLQMFHDSVLQQQALVALPNCKRRASYLQSHDSKNPNGLPLAKQKKVFVLASWRSRSKPRGCGGGLPCRYLGMPHLLKERLWLASQNH